MEIRRELIKLETKNKNRRIYSKDVFRKALKEYQVKIDEGQALGELGHPESFDISFSNVSHKIDRIFHKYEYPKVPRKLKKKMKKAGTYEKSVVYCDATILNTDKGEVAKSIIEDLAVALRGTGNIDDNGYVSDYTIHSVDLINRKDKA
jgi:hypothetical protein